MTKKQVTFMLDMFQNSYNLLKNVHDEIEPKFDQMTDEEFKDPKIQAIFKTCMDIDSRILVHFENLPDLIESIKQSDHFKNLQ